jgi:aminomethyltransferase
MIHSMGIGALRGTPLEERHIQAGAKMVPFAGWNMPVRYTSIIQEHIHTRTKAGLFDTSHMGELFLRGASAFADLDRLATCRLDNLAVGGARYGFLLNTEGGFLDDLIVYRTAAEEFLLVVNAATTEKDLRWIETKLSGSTELADESAQTAMLSLQGPLSLQVLSPFIQDLKRLRRFAFLRADVEGIEALVSRTGYTGELGFELFVSSLTAERLWDLLVAHVDVLPVGLGARDTLRLEMGYPLYGSDIDETHTPIEANLMRFVYREKEFIGREVLSAKSDSPHILTGFICEGRRSARAHFDVTIDERKVGVVTSGAFSALLKRGMGLCYIDRSLAAEGQRITLRSGETEIKAGIKIPPLYRRRTALCNYDDYT